MDESDTWTGIVAARLRHGTRAAIDRSLESYPGLRALSLATWLADDSFLAPDFRERMRASGMAHVLAVSGQHVILLAAMTCACLRGFALLRRPRGSWLRKGMSMALPLSALLLWVLCPREGSVHRAFVTAIAAAALRGCAWSACRFRIFAFALLFAIALSPNELEDWGFLLSLGGTFLLLCCVTSGCGWLGQYVGLSLAIPIFALPLQAHFFGACDGWMLVHAVSWSWIWSLLWIPTGFAAPLAAFCGFPLGWLEEGWIAFGDGVRGAAFLPVALPRPRFWEAVAWVFLCAGGALSLAAPCIDFRGKSVSNK